MTHARLVALALLLVITGEVYLAAQPIGTIRVYDMVLGGSARRAAVLETARSILADAGVDAVWVDCAARPRDGEPSPCRTPRREGDLVIRIIPDGQVPAPDGHNPLGYAVVGANGRGGALATVFADRVQRVAAQSRANPDVLLGRAVAHEVGHLLLRSQSHSRSGLMREVWSDAELFGDRPEDWRFSAAERASLRAAAARISDIASN